MSRREFSKKVMRDAAIRADGLCEFCSRKLLTGDFHYDHIIPDALGGEPTLDNCQVLCRACHGEKTAKKDVPTIAKAKRVRDRNIGIKRRKGPPMMGSRESKYKRKLDGSVELR